MKYIFASLLIAVACLAGNTIIEYNPTNAPPSDFYDAFSTAAPPLDFNMVVQDNLQWLSRDKTLRMHRHEELVTNWVTVETIDLGEIQTFTVNVSGLGNIHKNRVVQVGKVVTNEVIRIEFQQHTNFVTYAVGESGYTIQQTITNEAPLTVYGSVLDPGTHTH